MPVKYVIKAICRAFDCINTGLVIPPISILYNPYISLLHCMCDYVSQKMRRQLDLVLQQKIAQPRLELYNPDRSSDSPNSKLIQAIIDLITREDYSEQVLLG